MSNNIYTRFSCDAINICANPSCSKSTNNPKYCGLSCGSIHRGMLNDRKSREAYAINPKICIRSTCDNIIPFETRNLVRYCSHSCSATVNNTGRIRKPITDEFRQKMRDINLRRSNDVDLPQQSCQICSIVFYRKESRKTCSKVCTGKLIGLKMKDYIKKTPGHKYNRSPIKQSWMELSFETWLNANGVNKGLTGYLTEIRFYNANSKKNGRADFVFPRLRLIIELDGTHHITRKELDDIRDAHLNQRGWTVLRISHAEYKKQSKLDEIKQLLKL